MKQTTKRSRHGLNALKARVKVRGLQAIDRRTVAARALIAWREELVSDLGGEETISAQQRALVDLATRTRLYVESLDGWLLGQKSLVNARKRSVHPVLTCPRGLYHPLRKLPGVGSLLDFVPKTFVSGQLHLHLIKMVGAIGFEPTTSRSRS